jgi:hypothetical protein
MYLEVTSESPDLVEALENAWKALSDKIGIQKDLRLYLNEITNYLEKDLNMRALFRVAIIKGYEGPLIPSPQEPVVHFKLPSPNVNIVINEACRVMHVNITIYLPRPGRNAEENCVFMKIASHELLHLYLNLEFLRGIKKEFIKCPSTCSIKQYSELLEIEETMVNFLVNEVLKSITIINKSTCADIIQKYKMTYAPKELESVGEKISKDVLLKLSELVGCRSLVCS